MPNVFVLRPNENWIVDQMVSDWYTHNADISVDDPINADVIWLLADWTWNKIPASILTQKKVITTVHHIVPEKFNVSEFEYRDTFTHVYHVPNEHTRSFIERYTKKPIITIPYWANQNIWGVTSTRDDLRIKFGIPSDAYVIGSFQRDTEGSDLRSPKLEKGPDLFADAVIKLHKTRKNILVLLAGWRRQYVINRLNLSGVPFVYMELPQQNVLNELYQALDLYLVTSRYEGGPQALIECGLTNIPVCSRDVGIASVVLEPHSINDDVTLAIPSVPKVDSYTIPSGFEAYRKLILEIP